MLSSARLTAPAQLIPFALLTLSHFVCLCLCACVSLSLDLSGVSQLTARDVTDTSVTLFWTPPQIQYKNYHITFTSQVKKNKAKGKSNVQSHHVVSATVTYCLFYELIYIAARAVRLFVFNLQLGMDYYSFLILDTESRMKEKTERKHLLPIRSSDWFLSVLTSSG